MKIDVAVTAAGLQTNTLYTVFFCVLSPSIVTVITFNIFKKTKAEKWKQNENTYGNEKKLKTENQIR
jgi:hypothetical protein